MAVTRAVDHEVSGLSDDRYCTPEDVVTVLKRVSVDTAQETLGAWLGHEDRDELIRFYIPEVRQWVNGKAGHDFDYHEDVSIALDGTALDVVDLSKFGFAPLISVSSLVVSNSAQDSDDYVYYSDGRIRPVSVVSGIKFTPGRPYPFFVLGAQNVVMTATWGYVTPPPRIKVAQARKIAANILSALDAADAEDGVVPGGTTRLSYGDLSIQMGTAGRFAAAIERLDDAALEACQSYRFPKANTASAQVVGNVGRTTGIMWE